MGTINYQVCQKSAPYFNAITNTKNCLYWYKFIDYPVAIELLRRVSTLLKGLIRQKKIFFNGNNKLQLIRYWFVVSLVFV